MIIYISSITILNYKRQTYKDRRSVERIK